MEDKPLAIQELVNKAIADERSDREHKHWHVSSLGNCLTGQYLERLGKKPDQDFNERMLRVFHVGRVFEDWILKLLAAKLPSDLSLDSQTELVDEELDVMGHPDALVSKTSQKGSYEHIYEMKTIHSKGFWYMQNRGEAGYDHHRLQLWMYLYMTQTPKGSLVYLSKDDLTIAEYPVLLADKKIEKQAMEILGKLNEAWKTKTPPEPILDEKDWRAKFCNYHKQCLKTVKANANV